MENKENNKSLFRRYLMIYILRKIRNLMNELQTNTEIFQELADDVWEEAA